jgi:glycosyltransferase involved in cell wall biosynthesis
MKQFKISVVAPAYNEELNIEILLEKLSETLKNYPSYEIIVVDDGSTDNSLEILRKKAEQNPNVKYLSFSRNFGHQVALRAGLEHAIGHCIICIDADMQHPMELIPQMIDKWLEGYEVVYTVRKDTKQESFFKRKTSSLFYKLIQLISDIDLNKGSADFKLIDKKVLSELKKFKETNLFLRGIIAWIGFRQFALSYTPNPRQSGESKYSFKKMFLFAITGITAFTNKPLYISIFIGFVMFLIACGIGVHVIYIRYFTNEAVLGWASIIGTIILIGSIQLIIIGIIGIYLGKMFEEVKNRPHYITKESNLQSELRK